MRRSLLALLILTLVALAGAPATSAQEETPRIRFAAAHVFIDSGDVALAAYQLDVRATAGDVRIVGIEGGEHAAFAEPPYYDPAAMRHERVVVGAFSTAPAAALPSGRTRVVTIHVEITGDVDPVFAAVVEAAATAGGEAIEVGVTVARGTTP